MVGLDLLPETSLSSLDYHFPFKMDAEDKLKALIERRQNWRMDEIEKIDEKYQEMDWESSQNKAYNRRLKIIFIVIWIYVFANLLYFKMIGWL